MISMNFQSHFSISGVTRLARILFCVVGAALLVACAHPISIEATAVPERGAQQLPKKVAYVMTAADRQKQVVTDGGGGDKVSYYPYRDFERALRAALSVVYADVSVVPSVSDVAAVRESGAALIFVPEISTTSYSSSILTWPPTMFTFNVTVNVVDAQSTSIARLRVNGNGNAEWEEFKGDFGLAGRRAVEAAAKALIVEIRRTERLL
jgi:hypothetical protein